MKNILVISRNGCLTRRNSLLDGEDTPLEETKTDQKKNFAAEAAKALGLPEDAATEEVHEEVEGRR